MAVTITISEPLSKRLQAHAQTFQLPLDALVEKLLAEALPADETNGFGVIDERVPADQPTGELDDPDADLARIVAQIKATPPNPDAIERATKSAQEVAAELLANPPSSDLLTFEEFWPLWQAFERELKEMDEADAIDEGRL